MNIVKRILLYAGMVISVIVLVISLAGIVGAWYYNTPLTQIILDIVVPITDAVQSADTIAEEAGVALQEVSTGLAEAEQEIQKIGAEVTEANLAVEAVSTLVGEDIEPRLNEIRSNTRAVYDTLGIVQQAIQSFNEIPFIDMQLPGDEALGQVRTGIEQIVAETGELSRTLQEEKSEIVEGAVEQVAEPINRLKERLVEIQATLAELGASLKATVESLLFVQENTAYWIDLLSIAITVILLWIGISQVALFVLCRKMLQGKMAA